MLYRETQHIIELPHHHKSIPVKLVLSDNDNV